MIRLAQSTLTEDDEGLLRGVRCDLVFGMSAFPDLIAHICDGTKDREVGKTPCPSEGLSNLASFLGRSGKWRGRIRQLTAKLEGHRPYPAVEGCSGGGGRDGSR